MSRFLKINAVAFSREHYNTESSNSTEKKHVAAIKAAATRYINIHAVDEIVPAKRTVKDDKDQDVEIDSTYLVIHYEAPLEDRGSHAPRDRDSFILVDGLASEWKDKIEAMITEDIAAHHPEPASSSPFNDKGVWKAGADYVPWDTVTDPDDSSKRYVCVKAHATNSKLVLTQTEFWSALPASA